MTLIMSGRREFLKKGFYTLLSLLGLGFLVPAGRVLLPKAQKERDIIFIPLILEDDLPRTGVKRTEIVYTSSGREVRKRVFVVSSEDGLIVLSAVCSHLGCLVNYRREKGGFVCPCHGGRYDLSGRNISGPPPAPLTRFPVRIEDGRVLVGVKA